MDQSLIKNILIVGGGSAGWMTASYLSKAFGNKVNISLVESPEIPKIGVGEATIPNLQKVFFDFLGLKEEEWMPECNASFKAAIKFVNWNDPNDKNDYFYHMFGQVKNIDDIPLTHYWNYFRENNLTQLPMAYDCYDKARLLDKNLSPKTLTHEKVMSHAWHFDAHLVAKFLKKLSISWGVKHIEDEVINVSLNENGYVKSVTTNKNGEIEADLFIDCSGFKGLIINQALKEPCIGMSDQLFCNSAVAASIKHDDEENGIEPYTSAIAMKNGWTWKIPMLGRFGSGYVYSDEFSTREQATDEFLKLWNVKEDSISLNHIKFRTGRNKRAWVKNCVAIGLSSCFLEPLESTGLYFIYAAIYQLVKHFPKKEIDEKLVKAFNENIEKMFDDSRDFVQTHYFTTSRTDTAFWKANKNDLKLSDSLKSKLDIYKSGLVVCPPITTNEEDNYRDFDIEFSNFWTNSNYYCMFTGFKSYPNSVYPKILYDNKYDKAREYMQELKKREDNLLESLPSTYEYLKHLHSRK